MAVFLLSGILLVSAAGMTGCQGKENAENHSVTQQEIKGSDQSEENASETSKDQESDLTMISAAMDGSVSDTDAGENLPVSVQVTYELDGKKILPEDLKGKSGNLKMHFKFQNKAEEQVKTNGKSQKVTVPFLTAATLFLPTDTFSDVKVSDGKIIKEDDQNLVLGMACPGLKEGLHLKSKLQKKLDLKETVTVSAKVESFDLDFAAVMVTPLPLAELKESDLKDAEKLSDNMEKLTDASGKLSDGMNQMKSGASGLQTALTSYTDGVSQLKDGLAKLQKALSAGTQDSGENQNSLQMLQQASVAADQTATAQARKQMKEKVKGIQGLSKEQKEALYQAADEITISNVNAGMNKQLAAAQTALSTSLSEQMKQLQKSITQLKDGAVKLDSYQKQLLDGSQALVSGMDALQSGMKKLDQNGLQKLKEKGTDTIATLASDLRILKRARKQYAKKDQTEKYILEMKFDGDSSEKN